MRVFRREHEKGLRVLEGLSLRSIAGELGVSVMTVSRHEKAALAALREQLA